MKKVTRIDGCPGVPLGPHKTPAEKIAFVGHEPRGKGAVKVRHSFSPAALPQPRVRGGRRGRKNAKTEEARTRRQDADSYARTVRALKGKTINA